MSSAFSFVVGLLTAALSLLGFVQQNPTLPQTSQNQAVQVARQAITQATQVLATNSAGSNSPTEAGAVTTQATSASNPLIIFSFPTGGSQIGTGVPTTIQWSLADPSIAQKFPDLGLQLILIAGGDEIPLNKTPLPFSQTSFSWNVAQTVQFVPPAFTSGKEYQIEAELEYSGNAHFTCDPTVKGECDPIYDEPIQSEIVAAKQYLSESAPFNINASPETAKLSCTVTPSQSSVSVGQQFLLSWNSTNAQLAYVSGPGLDDVAMSSGVTWGSEKITLNTPGTYTYTVTAHGYSTNPGTATCTTAVTVSASGQQSSVPNIDVTSVSGLTVTAQYADMVPAEIQVYSQIGSAPVIFGEQLSSSNTSGTITFTLPNGTPSGSYRLVPSDSNGNTFELTDAGGNGYPASATFNINNPSVPVPPAPVISAVSPTSGPVGTQVTITGTGFTSQDNTVYIASDIVNLPSTNGTIITYTIAPSSLSAQIGMPHTYLVQVVNNNGNSNHVPFTLTAQ